jgi:NADP-dependent 3-hydroxy acid dehydrogenase YdfG
MGTMGKVVAITGASSGIGEAAARRLAADGARLVIGARRTDRLSRIAEEIESEGGTCLAAELDVTSRGSMDAFVQQALAAHGRIDVLVANAGVMLAAPLAEGRRDEWDRMIDLNIKGVLNGIAAALPPMMAQGSGHVILIGSNVGYRVPPMGGVYAATKFAVRAIAESLRVEGGKAIRSTLIAPGATRTEIVEHVEFPPIKQALLALRSEMLPAEAVAAAVAYAIDQPHEVDVSEILIRPIAMKD